MLSPEGNHYNGFFVNQIETDTPEVDYTVRIATPTHSGMLQVPSPSWHSGSGEAQEENGEDKDTPLRSPPRSLRNSRGCSRSGSKGGSKSNSRSGSAATTPTADVHAAPEFPERRSSAEIIRAIESANGNMGLFYRRSSAPTYKVSGGSGAGSSHRNDGGGGGKVSSIREQFEKKEREKIEQQLIQEAAGRGDNECVPIFV